MEAIKRQLQHEVIDENHKGLLVKGLAGGYETWIKIRSSRTGQLYVPTDEQFGEMAWSHYTLERAKKVFKEITEGTRTARVWQEDPEVQREIAFDLFCKAENESISRFFHREIDSK